MNKTGNPTWLPVSPKKNPQTTPQPQAINERSQPRVTPLAYG